MRRENKNTCRWPIVKNLCKRTAILQLIVEDMVTWLFLVHSVELIQELSYRKQIVRKLRNHFVKGIHSPKYYTVTLKI